MVFWILVVLLVAASLLAVAAPLWRRSGGQAVAEAEASEGTW